MNMFHGQLLPSLVKGANNTKQITISLMSMHSWFTNQFTNQLGCILTYACEFALCPKLQYALINAAAQDCTQC